MLIRLNHINLIDEDFKFKTFQEKISQDTDKLDKTFQYYIRQEKYSVAFEPLEGHKETITNSYDNINLTKRFIHNRLVEYCTKRKIEYINIKEFRIGLDIVYESLPQGKKCIYVEPYFFAPKSSYGLLIKYHFKKEESKSFDIDVLKLSHTLDKYGRSNKNYYSDIYKELKEGIRAYLNDFVILVVDDKLKPREFIEVQSEHLERKQYLLRNSNVANSQFLGVKKYGVYKGVDSTPSYLFVFENRFRTFANDLFRGLNGSLSPGTFSGMQQMFNVNIDKSTVRRISIKNNTIGEIEIAIGEIDKETAENKIVIYIEDQNKQDPDSSKAYYYLKYNLLRRKIPLQVISYQNVGGLDKLKWSISNIGLQIFAKLGGIPWIVKSPRESLILGLGSAHKYEDGIINRHFAYSVCLDSSGKYHKLEVLASGENSDDYITEFKDKLTSLLKSEEFSGYKRCALHLPFKIKKKEINAILESIRLVSDIEFVVVKVNTENKFFGFAKNNTLVPYESSYIKLRNDEFLVWFEGLQYGKELVNKRTANPVHIQFLHVPEDAKYQDYLQDIINLSGANWRGFNSKSVPVSIYYSRLVADYSSEFQDFEDYNTESISNLRPWFL